MIRGEENENFEGSTIGSEIGSLGPFVQLGITRCLQRGMEPNSVTFLFIGEAKLSRRDTPQLAAGSVHLTTQL